ncbi:hypothetical protein KF728_27530 [Candidatus Obscuribacterales bacterium]|nr:hypothetical protein [Candidatus Obscuribacterales bacterium]
MMSKIPDDNSPSVEKEFDFAVEKEPPSNFWKLVVSAFMFIYVASVVIWCFDDIPFKKELSPLSHWINIADGGVQYWGLFSPDVRYVIYHETALVSYKDGTMKLYEFPRMQKLSHWEKFKHEKLRKLFGDNIPWPGYESFLPNIAQFLAASNQDPKNQPAMVTMIFNSTKNPKPDPDHWNYRDNLPFHNEKFVQFLYSVRENDFVNDKSNSTPDAHKQSNLRVLEAK